MVFRSFCLVVTVVALGVWFAYMREALSLMRQRIELDERFCNLAEDMEATVLAMQIDLVNFQADMREVLRKRQ